METSVLVNHRYCSERRAASGGWKNTPRATLGPVNTPGTVWAPAHRSHGKALLRSQAWIALVLFLAAASAGAVERVPQRTKSVRGKTAPAVDLALLRARWHVLGARPLGMFYYANDSRGLWSLEAHARDMNLLGPQCFSIDGEGNLHGQIPPPVAAEAEWADLPVMPLVVNPGFNRATAHALLRDPVAQERAATALAALAEREEYIGWQLDFENIAPADKLLYTRFVERVAARLHRDHRLLSVAVVVRFSDRYPDRRRSAEFRTGEWGAPFNFRALGRVADFLTLMTYDQHSPTSPPGPVSGYDWTKAALNYAVRRVPRSKLLLGIPLYGREWVETSQGTKSHSLSYKDLTTYVESPDGEARWDQASRTTWFQVRHGDALRTAWYDDSRSLREKLGLIELYHLRGFAAWRLGVEDPRFWPVLAEFTPKQPPKEHSAREATKRMRSAATSKRERARAAERGR